uniref:Uncharacterized protein n=1 Tax=Rhipicephalus zambeziensis TaxID=60191 RepID=A0A224YG70_9ACAR
MGKKKMRILNCSLSSAVVPPFFFLPLLRLNHAKQCRLRTGHCKNGFWAKLTTLQRGSLVHTHSCNSVAGILATEGATEID